eukprot:CAMPEP_0196234444 /NCGR_PEP_ID=MMETSP0913-20130531/4545_1 /TAXON_ID=49265 /ORGANISM="Thalassiosira rotula, Strain GSO102" /LENGTH=55 /DNA_ID=CAMNT_0041515515 /DNA_START=121 /DNA_END=288 /DNA_ORIENTATION=+
MAKAPAAKEATNFAELTATSEADDVELLAAASESSKSQSLVISVTPRASSTPFMT